MCVKSKIVTDSPTAAFYLVGEFGMGVLYTIATFFFLLYHIAVTLVTIPGMAHRRFFSKKARLWRKAGREAARYNLNGDGWAALCDGWTATPGKSQEFLREILYRMFRDDKPLGTYRVMCVNRERRTTPEGEPRETMFIYKDGHPPNLPRDIECVGGYYTITLAEYVATLRRER